MKFESTVGEYGEIIIPNDIRKELRLAANTPVSVEVSSLSEPTPMTDQDWEGALAQIAKLRENMRAELLADGYATTDEYIADIRGR
jgi:bifunctional DNA-binding transcriptional regulator/antitoxin component of YhaV-PrlF toxin-antitoxin module